MVFHFAPKSKMNDGKQTKRMKRKTNFINLEYSKRLCVFAFSNCNWPPDDSIEWQDKQQRDGYAAGFWWYVDARKWLRLTVGCLRYRSHPPIVSPEDLGRPFTSSPTFPQPSTTHPIAYDPFASIPLLTCFPLKFKSPFAIRNDS